MNWNMSPKLDPGETSYVGECRGPRPRMPPVPSGTFVRKEDSDLPKRYYTREEIESGTCGEEPSGVAVLRDAALSVPGVKGVRSSVARHVVTLRIYGFDDKSPGVDVLVQVLAAIEEVRPAGSFVCVKGVGDE
jgi:hypothetical protein